MKPSAPDEASGTSGTSGTFPTLRAENGSDKYRDLSGEGPRYPRSPRHLAGAAAETPAASSRLPPPPLPPKLTPAEREFVRRLIRMELATW